LEIITEGIRDVARKPNERTAYATEDVCGEISGRLFGFSVVALILRLFFQMNVLALGISQKAMHRLARLARVGEL
jgi:hypothetical protein